MLAIWRRTISFATALLLGALFSTIPVKADKERDLRVMTRNMDAGTDLAFIAVPPPGQNGVQATLDEIAASNPLLRAEFLAEEIVAQQPDVIALQEVTTIRTGPHGQTVVLFDQLQLLLDALAVHGLHYAAVAVNTLTDVEIPLSGTTWVHYTDHDVVLANADLKHSDLNVSNVKTHIYQAMLPFSVPGLGTLPVLRGWISADLKVRGKTIRFINTHLESTYSFDPTGVLQSLQTRELVQSLAGVTGPVLLCGDFNANAEPIGPEQTPTPGLLQAAGFADAWHTLHPTDHGYTWPLFGEDYFAGSPVVPNERIDLVFTRDADPASVLETGLSFPAGSDHAGVVATINFFK